MWIIEYVDYECLGLGCRKKWQIAYDYDGEIDNNDSVTMKFRTAKDFCSECLKKLEEKNKGSKEERPKAGSRS